MLEHQWVLNSAARQLRESRTLITLSHSFFPYSVLTIRINVKCNAGKAKACEIHLQTKQLFSESKDSRKVSVIMIVIKVYLFPTSLLVL